jgi:CheY-like chemotaxis protein
MRVVLLVDDNVLARAQLARELRRRPSLDVVDAGALHEAVQLLDCIPVDILVSRPRLPDGDARALAPHLTRDGRSIPALLLADGAGALDTPPEPFTLVPGPMAPAAVGAWVAARLGPPPAPPAPAHPPTPRVVHIPPLGVPLPVVSRLAEASSPLPVMPALPPLPAFPAPRAAVSDAAEFERLYELGIDAMLARRYGEALDALLRAQKIRSTSTLEANLQRLRALGAVAT